MLSQSEKERIGMLHAFQTCGAQKGKFVIIKGDLTYSHRQGVFANTDPTYYLSREHAEAVCRNIGGRVFFILNKKEPQL